MNYLVVKSWWDEASLRNSNALAYQFASLAYAAGSTVLFRTVANERDIDQILNLVTPDTCLVDCMCSELGDNSSLQRKLAPIKSAWFHGNSLAARDKARNKLEVKSLATSLGIPTADTIQTERYLVKKALGTFSQGMRIVDSKDTALLPDEMIEPYLEGYREVHVGWVNNKALPLYMRKSQDLLTADAKANANLNYLRTGHDDFWSETCMNVPQATLDRLREADRELTKALGLTLSRSDWLVGPDNNFVLLETNSRPSYQVGRGYWKMLSDANAFGDFLRTVSYQEVIL